MFNETLFSLLALIAPQLPLYAVFIAGIVIALTRYSRHPQISRLMIIALTTLLLWSVFALALTALLPTLANSQAWTARSLSYFYSALSLVGVVVQIAAWICVLCAVFGWRDVQATRPTWSPSTPVKNDR